MIKFIKQLLIHIAILNIGGLLLLGLLSISGMYYEKGISPYFLEVAKRTQSIGDLLKYCLLLIFSASIYELFIRLLLQRFTVNSSLISVRAFGVFLAASPALFIHSKYGFLGMIYAFSIGLFTAFFYQHTRNWKSLVLWHIQWDLMSVMATIVFALFLNGDVRNQYLYVYKLNNINAGSLVYREHWGWVDMVHYHSEKLNRILSDLSQGKRDIYLKGRYTTLYDKTVLVSCHFKVNEDIKFNKQTQWATASSMLLHFAVQVEKSQKDSPFYLGAQFSAWQFDDIPSTLLACLDNAPNSIVNKDFIITKDDLKQKWVLEGMESVSLCEESVKLPATSSKQQKKLFQQIQKSKVYWKCLSDKRY